MVKRNRGSIFQLELSKIALGLVLAIGLLYPLGSFWYIGVILGAVICGWGAREGWVMMKTHKPVAMHKSGITVLLVCAANAIKFSFF
ncbi:hypothetical protein HQ571_06450 [Candidatus Kuenenbacteria bacterium]|nr:hypothetical protein [Candidatus Kuenenbacteria bacterium]